jgi:formate hydrogenlyase subunit 3/multisubunit Na+/H+ antiporter MnhD subunit
MTLTTKNAPKALALLGSIFTIKIVFPIECESSFRRSISKIQLKIPLYVTTQAIVLTLQLIFLFLMIFFMKYGRKRQRRYFSSFSSDILLFSFKFQLPHTARRLKR